MEPVGVPPEVSSETAQTSKTSPETVPPESYSFHDLCKLEEEIHTGKAQGYVGEGYRWGNFDRVSKILYLYPYFPYDQREGVLIIYVLKHMDAIMNSLVESEGVDRKEFFDRILDVSIYMKLLYLMMKDTGDYMERRINADIS